MAEWQDISTARKDQERFILVYSPTLERTAIAKWQGNQWYGVDDYGLTFASEMQATPPTHWQPLPAPPAQESGG